MNKTAPVPEFSINQISSMGARSAFDNIGFSLPMMSITGIDLGVLAHVGSEEGQDQEIMGLLDGEQSDAFLHMARSILQKLAQDQMVPLNASLDPATPQPISFEYNRYNHEGVFYQRFGWAPLSNLAVAEHLKMHVDVENPDVVVPGIVYATHLTIYGQGVVRAIKAVNASNRGAHFSVPDSTRYLQRVTKTGDMHIFARHVPEGMFRKTLFSKVNAAPTAHEFLTDVSPYRTIIESQFGKTKSWPAKK